MNNKIWLSLAHMSGEEQKYIQEAFDTNWVVPLGPNVNAFEDLLQDYLSEDKKVVALVSGTSAIHLALIQLGVGPGDEVICQSFTFAATANPIKYLGANPIFIDSEPETWNMDPGYLEEAIADRIAKTGKKPKAIIPVDLYGMPANMDAILEIAARYEIPVLEDAAEALGSTYKGRKCGTFGEFACLSFNGNKMITTSGGGALVCSTKEQAKKTLFYATQARDDKTYYQHSEIGYNYRLSNICAGIGRGQMTVLDQYVARRREIHDIYMSEFSTMPGITVFDNPSPDYKSNFWLTCVQIDPVEVGYNNNDVYEAMMKADIECRPLWKPLHLQPVFANEIFYGNGFSTEIFNRGLCLPSSPVLTEYHVERVVDVFRKMKK
ncbi:MAG: aminotransferase class I/II-fold pyridoxal phosphate-dependent enzyme [Paludibacter sp.]|nr:aminotransferase class I/II-fold pyridoxal phosphate-dependent enzyme [Paludibacter sp.]